MKLRKKLIPFLVLTACLVLFCSMPVFAAELTEADVEAAVASQGKEAVTGNVFVWFLCAIAFLKVSQKIDSFLASLGINVGNTGGNMMAELLIAGRSLTGSMRSRGRPSPFCELGKNWRPCRRGKCPEPRPAAARKSSCAYRKGFCAGRSHLHTRPP